MTVCSVDFETYGTVELKRTGVYPYASHHDTGIWCLAYAFDEEEPEVWEPDSGVPFPERLREHIESGGQLRAWNAAFERIMWKECLRRRVPGIPVPRDEQWHCTMAEAQAQGLPRALDYAASVLRLQVKKDMEGKKLMLRMCRARKFDEEGRPVWWNEPALRVRLGEYCKQDVRTERGVQAYVRPLGARERAVYLLTQRLNDRGIQLDLALVAKAREVAQTEIDKQNALLAEATSGKVTEVTKVAKLKEWLATQGVVEEDGTALASLNKAAVRELLTDTSGLSSPALQALQARQEAAKSSLGKLDAMLDCAGRDGRARGLLLYYAATTGRWAGMLIQPHNFPRGNDVKNPAQYIPQVMRGESTPLNVLSAMLRSMMTASGGHELLCSDFASIEARLVAWLAGQQDLVDAFAAGAPIYKMMAARVYGCSVQDIVKPSDEYTLGKSLILGCGFQMGAKKFVSSSWDQYGLRVAPELAEEAVRAYRQTYPQIVSYWREVNDAAIQAVMNPGEIQTVRKRVRFVRREGYLWVVLPAGRALAYANPKIVERPMPWDKSETRPAVEFSGINGYTRKWERMALYGGWITENIVQATARDLLAEAMLRTEKAGYPMLLSVHDEIVSERAVGEGSLEEFENLMKQAPKWAEGCPITCESWRGARYRK